ncbi:hypothetical protein F3Y22_tig00110332pilonHSYRG00022 [Hibiscus syriacus]|uniref:Uncharacterized protein n=1 Tax=Hibiscus syriacus TaxID=106335 RepID=A0A6A3AZ09_HIBSY|nr:hypothetical protein F3Y22_tig00110332pilonHSYRG00022 [Hibiscus syriacus]
MGGVLSAMHERTKRAIADIDVVGRCERYGYGVVSVDQFFVWVFGYYVEVDAGDEFGRRCYVKRRNFEGGDGESGRWDGRGRIRSRRLWRLEEEER